MVNWAGPNGWGGVGWGGHCTRHNNIAIVMSHHILKMGSGKVCVHVQQIADDVGFSNSAVRASADGC